MNKPTFVSFDTTLEVEIRVNATITPGCKIEDLFVELPPDPSSVNPHGESLDLTDYLSELDLDCIRDQVWCKGLKE